MAESEEEGEILEYVTDYHLVNSEDEPVSFEILPFKWSKSDVVDNPVEEVSLSGTTDVGLRKIFKKVVAWKFDLSCAVPVISVLTLNNNWIILQKPRKPFEAVIRRILITVHWLHFVKKNPAASEPSVWNHVLKKFRGYVVEPSEDDLYHHLRLISEAEKRDKDLASSEYLLTFMAEPHFDTAFSQEIKQKRNLSLLLMCMRMRRRMIIGMKMMNPRPSLILFAQFVTMVVNFCGISYFYYMQKFPLFYFYFSRFWRQFYSLFFHIRSSLVPFSLEFAYVSRMHQHMCTVWNALKS